MKNRLLGSGLLGMLLLLGHSSVQAIMLNVAPATQDAVLGSTLSVQLNISGLGDATADSLGAFDLDFTYDPALLAFNNVSFGDQLDVLGFGSITGIDSSVAGLVNLFEVSLDLASDLNVLQSPAFTLATLTFDTLAIGSTALVVSNTILSNAVGDPLFAEISGGRVNVVPQNIPMPLPGSFALIALGLIVGAGVARHRT